MNPVGVKPYVDYYEKNAISPVSQDLSDLRRHLERRGALYRSLRIHPHAVQGRSVVEFGPGSAHNAIHTSALGPARYVLVEGNPVGLREGEALLKRYFPASTMHEFVHSTLEEFRSDERFDVALCEGLLPFQLDPAAFVQVVGSFVQPGGILVVTCMDSVSFLPEMLRRMLASVIVDRTDSIQRKLEQLRPFFGPQLATIGGMSRPVDDWILDNVLQPFLSSKTFSIAVAIDALAADFEIYGSSPEFFLDWRWYKTLYGDRTLYGENAKRAYWSNLLNFLDYREVFAPHPEAFGKALLARTDDLLGAILRYEDEPHANGLAAIAASITDLASFLRERAPGTSGALEDAADFLRRPPALGQTPRALDAFGQFFGRGQQYLSFVRSAPPAL